MKKPGKSYKRVTPDDRYDAILIGSGMGSMTCAVALARYAGMRVLLLERHYVAGGYTHSFKRPGYDWDVGIHYIGEAHQPDSEVRRMFDFVTGGGVQWQSMGEVYDKIILGDDVYEFCTGIEAFKARMLTYFPGEEQAISTYIRTVKESVASGQLYFTDKALPLGFSRFAHPLLCRKFFKFADRTVQEVMDSITPNKRLQSVLIGQFGDYGLPPTRASFAIHAMVTNHYFEGGAYPIGGASEIAAGAEAVLESYGGQILINAEVDTILVEDGSAVGVRMADGREIRARHVISGAGIYTTVETLLDANLPQRQKMQQGLGDVGRSAAHFCLYLGLNQSTEDLQLETPNLWIYRDEHHTKNFEAFEQDPESPLPVVYVSFPSAKDPNFAERYPGHAAIDVITLAKASWFAEWDGTAWMKRGEAYEARKQAMADRLLEVVYKHLPQIKESIDVAEISTPLTTRHFCNYGGGEIYGLDHTPARFRNRSLRPHTPIKGLWLTGQDICSAGVAGAMFGGILTASAITGKNMHGKALSGK